MFFFFFLRLNAYIGGVSLEKECWMSGFANILTAHISCLFIQTGRQIPLSEGATSPGHNVTVPLHQHGSKYYIVGGGKAEGLRAGKMYRMR